MKRLALCGAIIAATSFATAEPAAADPPTISVTPTIVRTGASISFEASPANAADSWDLDGDGAADKLGSPVDWRYRSPGPVRITLHASDGQVVTKDIQVRGPSADFVSFPAAPVAGQEVKLVYTQREEVNAIEWDLNADGTFGDVKGPIATATFPVAGTYAVSLQVTNLDEPPARSTSTQLITVGPPTPLAKLGGGSAARLMSPFPVIRITGKVGRNGARIKRLTVRAPGGATVSVRCRGRGCPFKRTSRTLALTGSAKSQAKTVRIKKLEHHLLHGGVSLKVLVSRPGEIGKYTRFRIRRNRPPVRSDLCLTPGSTAPMECPSS